MAERRMFAKTIVLSDAFLDMPLSARCLYFTLGMMADDDGFVGSPKAIMRQCGASQDDLVVLLQKRFVLGFESGVIVIKHWRMNNYLQNDRKKDTTYLEELAALDIDKNGAYTEHDKSMYTKCIQNVYTGKDSIDKVSIDKVSIVEDSIGECVYGSNEPTPTPEKPVKHQHGEYKKVLLTDDELSKLYADFGKERTDQAIEFLDSYIVEKSYKSKSHYIAIRRWVFQALDEQEQRRQKFGNAGTNKVAQQLDSFYEMARDWAERG